MNPFGGGDPNAAATPQGNAGGLLASGAMQASGPSTGAPHVAVAEVDTGRNCHPEFMSISLNAIPATQGLLQKTSLPLGLCVRPLAEGPNVPETPLVDLGAGQVVRCEQCRAYMNPFVQWHENGTTWSCNFCGSLNTTPSSYYCGLDANGKRHDADKRPELNHGSVEFVAPDEYMVRVPVPPAYVFVLDVSFNAVQSGMLASACEAILESLDALPGGDRTHVAIITFDTAVHFYSLKSTASAPAMLVVPDIDNVLLPAAVEDMLVNLSDARPLVEALLESLPAMHANSKAADVCLGPALNAAYDVMQHLGGKLMLCLSRLPSLGQGHLLPREAPKMLGSDEEHKLLAPDTGTEGHFYRNRAVDFSRQQICVDMFMLGNQYTDVATIGSLARYTAGQVHFYQAFSASVDGPRLQADILHSLSRTVGLEAVMRVRVSAGLSISNFYGNFFIRGQDLLTLPNVTCDTAFNVEMTHSASLAPGSTVAIQGALLYTTPDAQRRILVHTMAVPVTTALADVFNNASIDSVQNMIAKVALDTTLRTGLPACRRYLHRTVVEVSRAYAASQSPLGVPQAPAGGGVNLPDSLQLLPLYAMALQKSILYRGGSDITSDERASLVYSMLTMPATKCRWYAYPRLLSLHDMEQEAGRPVPGGGEVDEDEVAGEGNIRLPTSLHCTEASLDAGGVYLLDDGVEMFLWVGTNAPAALLQSLFGVPSLAGANTGGLQLVEMDNEYSQRVLSVVSALQEGTSPQQKMRVVRQGAGDFLEARFRYRMVEDRQNFQGGTLAYADYLMTVARESNTGASGMMHSGGASNAPGQSSMPGPPGAPNGGNFGGPPASAGMGQQQQPGQYGGPPASAGMGQQQQPGQYGGPPASAGMGQQQQPGQYGGPPAVGGAPAAPGPQHAGPPSAANSAPGGYGAPPGNMGGAPAGFSQPGQFGGPPGSAAPPGAPGQFGAPPAPGGPGMYSGPPRM